MMFYIPEDWFIDKNNMDEVFSLFNKYYESDVIDDELIKARKKELPEELEKLGEIEILRHYEKGDLIFD